jgi:hypothetical protein
LAEELHSVGKELPSREDQLKVAKKRTREQRATKKKEHKRKERRHRRSLSDTELEVPETTNAPKTGGTPGRRQLNRLLSTSKKLLPRFASDNHDERPTSGASTTDNTGGASRKFLKARRKASASSAATLD